MTGTALTEAAEFTAIYRLDIVEIPTNRPVPQGLPDAVYKTEEGKYRAVIEQVMECHERPARAGGYRQRGKERDARQNAYKRHTRISTC